METASHMGIQPTDGTAPAVLGMIGIFFLVSYPFVQFWVMERIGRRSAERRPASESPTMRVRPRH